MVRYLRIKVKTALSKSGLPDLDYALNPYVGCFHACIYCYAPQYSRSDVARSWGSLILIKENLIEVLQREVRTLKRGVVGISTITDPYQPVEEEERLVRGSLEVLLKSGFHASLQTKSDLIVRDLDIMRKYIGSVDAGFTITTLDDDLAKRIEPHSPPPSRRARALEKLSGAGVETWIFYGPVIPGVNDDLATVREIAELAKLTNSKLLVDRLRIKPAVLRNMRKGDLNLDKILNSLGSGWWTEFTRRARKVCEELKVQCTFSLSEEPTFKTLEAFMSRE